MTNTLRKLSAYLLPGTVGTSPTALAMEFDGAIPNLGPLIQQFGQLTTNSAPQSGTWNYVTDATGTGTWSASVVPPGLVSTTILQSGQAGITKTTPTATQIIAAGFPGAYIGQTGLFVVANTNSGTLTVAAGTGVTLAGTTTVLTVSARWYQFKVTNLANPAAVGAAATNTTTTTAAVAATSPTLTTNSVVIPVTATTGMTAGTSVLQVLQTNGTYFTGTISAINSLNVTVLGTNSVAIASGAAVNVFNNTVTMTGMFTVAANVAA